MHTFQEIAKLYSDKFATDHFPKEPSGLYEPAEYFLGIGGKRIRPIACLMGNELFGEIEPDSWHVANALELFHNFTLLHDDIMDESPLRRGKQTVHLRDGVNTAILSGDVMLIRAYEYLTQVTTEILPSILKIFNKAATEVCEGQQLDMDFESRPDVNMDQYTEMIKLKTSVLLAASLETGAIMGGATKNNCDRLYGFGKNLGLAFQIQDDYLDCFGDPKKFGKQVGGDILRNKKTFLLIRAQEVANASQKEQLNELLSDNKPDKVEKVISLYKAIGVDSWANQLKEKYAAKAMQHLEEVVVMNIRKKALMDLADYLLQRQS